MCKIDKRKHYVLVLDTETANTMSDEKGQLDTSSTLMYDCGWSVMAVPHGEIYEERSFVNSDVFVRERELMQSAYYAKKIPQYEADLASGKRKMATTYEIRQAMLADLEKYGIIGRPALARCGPNSPLYHIPQNLSIHFLHNFFYLFFPNFVHFAYCNLGTLLLY